MTVWAVLEAVTAGLCGPDPEPSLLAEGQAMWAAVLTDLALLPGCRVSSLVDARLVPDHVLSASAEIQAVTADWETQWNHLCGRADHAIIIAPESGGQLESLVTRARQHVALDVHNASPEAIRLCSDKLALARHLIAHQIPTIPTEQESWVTHPDFPCVLKPRDGAGSWLVRRVDDATVWRRVAAEYAVTSPDTVPIRQPYIPGRALSVAGWFSDQVDWLPVGEQNLSTDGCFRYLGGRIPAPLSAKEADAIRSLVEAAAATIPGLRGFIGFDVLQPADRPFDPLLVEINPRFTTSYIGYRMWQSHLLRSWLSGYDVDTNQNRRVTVTFKPRWKFR